jgi:hypothetical protein
MASMVIRTALLINTTSRLTRDTPINKPSPESNSQRVSHVAANTLSTLPKKDDPVSSQAQSKLHYYKQLDETNRQRRELAGAFRARL